MQHKKNILGEESYRLYSLKLAQTFFRNRTCYKYILKAMLSGSFTTLILP